MRRRCWCSIAHGICNLDSEIAAGGLWGAIIGDALGVPVEFVSCEEVRRNPITGMRGYGTFNLPPGTWSDDSSLLLCTVESLTNNLFHESNGKTIYAMAQRGILHTMGDAFDVGNSTLSSIRRMMMGTPPEKAVAEARMTMGTDPLRGSCR